MRLELGAAVRVIFRPHPDMVTIEGTNDPENGSNDPVNAPVNDPVNERQKWFLEQLASGGKTRATDLMLRWNVSPVTAKRDIADLKERGKIEYVGSPKTGWYRQK